MRKLVLEHTEQEREECSKVPILRDGKVVAVRLDSGAVKLNPEELRKRLRNKDASEK